MAGIAASASDHERTIRELRADSNAGFDSHDAERIASHWLPTMVVTQATLGEHTVGAATNRAMLQDMFEERPDVVYTRTPTELVVSPEVGFASEEGRWLGRWSGTAERGETAGAPMRRGGVYFAQWQWAAGAGGAPRWLLKSEVFAPVAADSGHEADEAAASEAEEQIRRRRAESCRAIADYDVDGIASHWLPEVCVTNSDGSTSGGGVGGFVAVQAHFRGLMEAHPDVCFNRIPHRVEVDLGPDGVSLEAPGGGVAAELGTWQGTWSEDGGRRCVHRSGRFMAQWRWSPERARWLINSEVYVLEKNDEVGNPHYEESHEHGGHTRQQPQIKEPRTVYNDHGQPLGLDLGVFAEPVAVEFQAQLGRYCRLEPVSAELHAPALHACLAADTDGSIWTYAGPDELGGDAPTMAQVVSWLRDAEQRGNVYAIIVPVGSAGIVGESGGVAAGTVAFSPGGSAAATIGHVVHSPLLQGTRAATDAHFLVLDQLFASGYRRVVWSCDAHNRPSVECAQRLGFLHEATERYVGVQSRRGRRVSRSESYLTILGYEWEAVRYALRTWLHPSNFDESGQQRLRLSELTAALRPPMDEPPSWPLVGEPRTAYNELGHPLGADLEGWTPPSLPPITPMVGRHCRLEPVSADAHAQALFEELSHDPDGLTFTYTGISGLSAAPTMEEVVQWLKGGENGGHVFAILVPDEDGEWRPVGTLQHQGLKPEIGVASIGFVVHTPKLRSTIAGTEAHALALKRLFDCGFRRVEWGCDSNNADSRRFAARLGFKPEGELRLTRGVTKPDDPVSGNRHYSILDFEWPDVDAALQAWLAPINFTDDGVQRRRLQDFRQQAANSKL